MQENIFTFVTKQNIGLQIKQNQEVVFIEVQYGSYFGEDDIVRLRMIMNEKISKNIS